MVIGELETDAPKGNVATETGNSLFQGLIEVLKKADRRAALKKLQRKLGQNKTGNIDEQDLSDENFDKKKKELEHKVKKDNKTEVDVIVEKPSKKEAKKRLLIAKKIREELNIPEDKDLAEKSKVEKIDEEIKRLDDTGKSEEDSIDSKTAELLYDVEIHIDEEEVKQITYGAVKKRRAEKGNADPRGNLDIAALLIDQQAITSENLDEKSKRKKAAAIEDSGVIVSESQRKKDTRSQLREFIKLSKKFESANNASKDMLVEGVKTSAESVGLDTEEVKAEIMSLLDIESLRKVFVENSTDEIRTQIALQKIEDDLRETLLHQEGNKVENLKKYKEENINRIVKDMFPVSTELAVQAAIKGKDSEEHRKMIEYTARREALQETMEQVLSQRIRNIELANDENEKNKLFSKILNKRKNESKRKTEDHEGEISSDKVSMYLTSSGHRMLHVKDLDTMVRLAPNLKRPGSDEVLSIEEVKKHIQNNQINSDGEDTGFQMAVTIDSTDEKGNPSKETVMVLYKEVSSSKNGQRKISIIEKDQLKIANIPLTKSEYSEQDAIEMIEISPAMLLHEMNHGIFEDYNRVLNKIIEENKSGKYDELRESLKKNEKTIRWQAAIDELSAILEEKTLLQNDSGEDVSQNNDMITLNELYIFEDEKYKETDEKIFKVLDIVNGVMEMDKNELSHKELVELIKQKFSKVILDQDDLEIAKEFIENENIDVKRFLNFYLQSFIISGETDINKLKDGLVDIFGDIKKGEEFNYLDRNGNAVNTENSVISDDEDTKLRDPINIIIGNLNKSPHNRTGDIDAHLMTPLHYDIPIPGVNFVQKFGRSLVRYNLAKRDDGYARNFERNKIKSFWDFWDQVQSNPGKITQKDKGAIVSSEIIGAFVRQAALHGRNPDEMLGYQTVREHLEGTDAAGNTVKIPLIDPRTGKRNSAFDKDFISNNTIFSDKKIDAGLAGSVMSTFERTPILRALYPRYHPAPWGMAMEKILGRGPVSRRIGRILWGKNVLTGSDDFQGVGFAEAPNFNFIPGYRLGDKDLNGNPRQLFEPDNEPGIVMTQEGNMTPKWNPETKQFELHSRIPVTAVLPSNEAHRSTHLQIMLGMMAKSGIDEPSLRMMLMKYIPELNFQSQQGMPSYDISEYKRALRGSDLNYRQRLRSGRYTMAKYQNKVLQNFLGMQNADQLGFDLNGYYDSQNDQDTYLDTINRDEEDVNWADNSNFLALDKNLKDKGIKDADISRGYVSEETLESMIDFINTYLEKGAGAGGGKEAGRVKEQAFMMRHVFRAMQYENAIRKIRKKFLLSGKIDGLPDGQNNLSDFLGAIDKTFQTEIDLAIRETDPKTEKKIHDRASAKFFALNKVVDQYFGPDDNPNSITFTLSDGVQTVLTKEQFKKLFIYTDVKGIPQKIVHKYNAEENGNFGLGDLEKISYNSEWNSTTSAPGVDEIMIGGGFKLHKMEIQAFQRTLYYIYSRDIMRRGLPPDAISIPGESNFRDKTLTSDIWYKNPDNPEYGLTMEKQGDQAIYYTYAQGYYKNVIEKFLSNQNNEEAKLQFFNTFNVEGNTDAEKFADLALKITGGNEQGVTLSSEEKRENFLKLIEILKGNRDYMDSIFGERSALQASFLNERNQLYTTKFVDPATELDQRFFEEGYMLHETEENLTRLIQQNEFFALMRIFLQEARRSIPYSKSRSEIFKNQAKFIKYFRWAVVAGTVIAAVTSPLPGLPLVLPFSPAVYGLMIGLSYYDAYYLSVKQKYWGMREVNSIKYGDEMYEVNSKLEQMIKQFKIPSGEEVEQYNSLKSRYEKMFEGISDVDDEELGAKQNSVTTFVTSMVGQLFS